MQKIAIFCVSVLAIFSQLNGALNLTSNQQKVLTQFNRIVTPTADELNVATQLVELTTSQFGHAMDLLSGEQYTSLFQLDIAANQRFIRRLYAPVRLYTTGFECCRPCSCYGVEPWLQLEGGHALLRNGHTGKGFKDNYWGISGGVQHCLNPCCIVGAAVDYSFDRVHYNLAGHNRMDSSLGALYGVFLLPDCYILADVIGGYSRGRVTRRIKFGDINRQAHGTSRLSNITGYAEMGASFCAKCLFVQPFVSIESGYYHRNHFREHGATSLNLKFPTKRVTTCDTRVGAHVTSYFCGFLMVNVDAAWHHRFNAIGDKVRMEFKDFGDEFSIRGPRQARDAVEGTVNVTAEVYDWLTAFCEFSGENWDHYSTWSVTGGVVGNF